LIKTEFDSTELASNVAFGRRGDEESQLAKGCEGSGCGITICIKEREAYEIQCDEKG
jgi:hypothetical protein